MPGGQTELAGHQIAFGVLRRGQALVWFRPVPTRVRHRLTQHEAVEVVADVVVVADRPGVASLVVTVPAGEFGFFGRRLGWRADDPQPQRCLHHGLLRVGIDTYTRAARGVRHLFQDFHAFEQVAFDFDVAGHVGAGEAEFVWRPQQSAQSSAVVDLDRPLRVRGACPASVPASDRDRGLWAHGCANQRRDRFSNCDHRISVLRGTAERAE